MTDTTSPDGGTTATATSSAADDGGAGRGRLAAVGETAAEAYQVARERTEAAFEAARETAQQAGRRTVDGIDSNPMAAIVGGLALGAVAALLLPGTQREDELLGSVGRRITDTAREAARAAREAGREQIDELGLSRDGVRRKLDEFTDRAVDAVKGAASGLAPATGKA